MKRLLKISNKVYLKDILYPNVIKTYGYNTDYGNRDFAVSYIDGELYEGDAHKDTVEEYLTAHDDDADSYLDFEQGFVTSEEQESIDIPMAFASHISGRDNKEYIAIYPETLFNVSMDKFILSLKNEYSNAILCIDNNERGMQQSSNIGLDII